jgi:hypothetical protein
MSERSRGPGRRTVLAMASAAIVASAVGATWWIVGRAEEGTAARAPSSDAGLLPAVDCSAAPYANRITGTIEGDLEVTEHGSVCEIRGTVLGRVTVHDGGASCDRDDAITAVDVLGGTIEGDIVALGGACVMVFLEDGARVGGDVVYRANGNLGFLGNDQGAWVGGSLLLEGGRLWAHGSSTTNRIDGDLVCDGGEPRQGLGSGSDANWDGWHDDVDGALGGSYTAC